MSLAARTLAEFFSDETLGSPENAVGFLLWKLVHRFQREIDRALLPLDLTHLQFTALAMVGWLNGSQGPATQAEIARYADIQSMQISQIMKVLAAKALIARTQSAANARAKCVEITPAGLAALRRAMPIAIDIQRRLFGRHGTPGGRLLRELKFLLARSGEPAQKVKLGGGKRPRPARAIRHKS